MLYISLSAEFIKRVNNFNKTWLYHIGYAESKFLMIDYFFLLCIISSISYSESVYPITPVEPLKATLSIILEFLYILFTLYSYKQ